MKSKAAKRPGASEVIESWAGMGVDLARLFLTLVPDADPASAALHRPGCPSSSWPDSGLSSIGSGVMRRALADLLTRDLCGSCLGSPAQLIAHSAPDLDNLATSASTLEHLAAFSQRTRAYRSLGEDASLKVRAKALTRIAKPLTEALALLESRTDPSAGRADPALADLVSSAEDGASAGLEEFVRLAQDSGVAAHFTAKALKEVRSRVDLGVPGLLTSAHAPRRALLRPALLALSTQVEFWDYVEPRDVTILAAFGFDAHHVVVPTCVALAFFADEDGDVIGSAPLKRSDSPVVVETALALFKDTYPTGSPLREHLKAARALVQP